MSRRKLNRIPRIRRFEYLQDYLEAVKLGLSEKETEAKISQRKREFETLKLQAIGRGRAFGSDAYQAGRLTPECRRMALHLGYVVRQGKEVTISETGLMLLESEISAKKQRLSQDLVQTYEPALAFMDAFGRDEQAEYSLPMKKDARRFKEVAAKQGLPLDQMSFEVLRDTFHFIGLVNWFPYLIERERYHKVYSSFEMLQGSAKPGRMTMRHGESLLQPRSVEQEGFRETLWKEYLAMTNYVPRRSALYSGLRDRVSYKLRISDEEFDEHTLMLLSGDERLRIVGSRGRIPYSKDTFAFLKNVPPVFEHQIPVYLKMDVRKK